MFRYLALSWDLRSEPASAAALAMLSGLTNDATWHVVLACPGLHVFTAGERAGVNESHALAGGRGQILGKLFSHDDDDIAAEHFASRPEETDAILHSSGRRLIERYWGRYVAFLPATGGGFHLLRDPSGGLPCFLVRHDEVDIAFSWLEGALACLPLLPLPAVDGECLAACLAFGELAGRVTALEGVTQVLPGESVSIGANHEPPQLLWNLSEHARSDVIDDVANARETLRETARHCVQRWADCYPSIVLRLSGGIDSSILASCLAADRTRTRVTCLNYHSPGADSDERHYARLAAARAGRELVEFERNPDFPLAQVFELALTPRPVNYMGRFGARMDIELARLTDSPAMFTGAGGDQLFFEFQRWWPAADYLRLRGVDRGLPAALMSAARLGKMSFWHTARLAIADLFRKGMPPPPVDRPWTLATEALWAPLKHPQRFAHPASTEAAALPIGKLMQVLQLTQAGNYYDPRHREAAPELLHPLLSQPLVELCLRIPTYVLTLDGRPRALAREAFANDLPPEIVARRSKGGLQAFHQTILDSHLDLARQVLLDGELVRRGLIDRARAEAALSSHRGTGQARASEIHLFFGVEAWLRRHAALRARRH